MLALRPFLLFALLTFTSPSIAGDMIFVNDLNMNPDSHPSPNIGCSHRYTGTVEAGDVSKFNIVKSDQTITVICLDSPGGSFAEAIKIGEYLRENNIGTLLEEDAKCLSACSLIFMAGSYYAHEVGSLFWRIMHPKSQLGFHVPSLVVSEGNYQKDSVEKAYQIAMKSIADMIFKLVQKEGFVGGNTIKTALMGHMISTPSNQMFMIDTIDKASRWDIRVEPVTKLGSPTDSQYYHACENLQKWSRDESASKITLSSGIESWVKRSRNQEQKTVTITTDEFSGESCEFIILGNYSRVTGTSDAGADFSSIQIHSGIFGPASTKLAKLRPPSDSVIKNNDTRTYQIRNLACSVIRNNRLIESHPCAQKPVTEKGLLYLVYTWQSGAKTVLETRSDGQMAVNGSPWSVKENIQGQECYLNQNSGNHFCIGSK